MYLLWEYMHVMRVRAHSIFFSVHAGLHRHMWLHNLENFSRPCLRQCSVYCWMRCRQLLDVFMSQNPFGKEVQ